MNTNTLSEIKRQLDIMRLYSDEGFGKGWDSLANRAHRMLLVVPEGHQSMIDILENIIKTAEHLEDLRLLLLEEGENL